jgi:hypothetical protein
MAITPGNVTTQTPPNQTFSTLKTEVARYVKAPSSTEVTGVAGDGINDAIRRLNSRVWEFNLDSVEITWVADQKEYDIEGDLKLPRHMELLNSSNVAERRLAFIPLKHFISVFRDRTGASDPRAYTIINPRNHGQITLDRAPSASWISIYPKARLWFYRYINVLSADGDVLLVPNDVERVILWGAKEYIAEMYGNIQQVEVARRHFHESFEELKKQHRRDDTDWGSSGVVNGVY